jgi:hypothetical protein
MQTLAKTIGFEIECLGSEILKKEQTIGKLKGDGSLRDCAWRCMVSHKYELSKIEIASKIHCISDIEGIKKQFEWLNEMYKKGHMCWNKSCGFHVHIGFENNTSPEIRSKEFITKFYKNLATQMPTEYKKRKNYNFCKEKGNIEHALDLNGRYFGINYTAIKDHKTIEFRIFPTAKPRRMFKYINFTIDNVNKFINKEIKIKQTINLDIKPVTINSKTNINLSKVTKLNAKKIKKPYDPYENIWSTRTYTTREIPGNLYYRT